MMEHNQYSGLEIAVIGMACEFKNSDTYHKFWKNIKNGVECIGYYSDDELRRSGVEQALIDNPHFVKINPSLSRRDYFDYQFFGFHVRDAKILSHQTRLLMESTWSALEDAGYLPQELRGKVGVYCGANSSLDNEIHAILQQYSHLSPMETSLLADKNYIATRLAYYYNFTGPAICVDTACSTSLVAIHLACQALLSGDCDMALAGGATILPDDTQGYLYQEGMIYSKDGHTRSFDAGATGTINSEGAGMVLLKTLDRAIKDKDHIHGIIRSTAVNNDGRRKVGYAAPSVKAQTDLIKCARQAAEIPAESICYIEAHGSGTIVGDPIEFKAIVDAFDHRFNPLCKIGSVKSNIGHAIHAAGIAGMVKVMKILQEKVIPPNLNYSKPNPLLEFEGHPLKVNTELFTLSPGEVPLRACINSLGIGGTNAHAVCEEAPKSATGSVCRSHYLLCLSAKTQSANQRQTEQLVEFIKDNPSIDLFNAAYTLTVGRTHFPHRSFLVVDSKVSNLEPQKFIKADMVANQPLAFIFPGLGLDFHPLAQDLYECERTFRECVDRCALVIKDSISLDISQYFTNKEAFGKAASGLSSFEIDQLATFVFCYSYASLFIYWGIQPAVMLGYSFGEIVAAVLAGVMHVNDALLLIIKRGQLISKTEQGGMLSVPVSKMAILPLLQGMELSIAIDNGESCVLAGAESEIVRFEEAAKLKKLICMRVKAQYGIHSHLMQPIVEDFTKLFANITLQKPKIPFISCVTGNWTDQNVEHPEYWIQHLCNTMCFVEGIHTLAKQEYQYVIIGPQHEYTSLLKRFLPKSHHNKIIVCGQANQYSDAPLKMFYQQVGSVWANGASINWTNFYGSIQGQRIPLPTYPFDRLHVAHKKSVIELMQEFVNGYSQTVQGKSSAHDSQLHKEEVLISASDSFPEVAREMMSTVFVSPSLPEEIKLVAIWEDFLGVRNIGLHDHFLELGGDSLKAITILNKLQGQFGVSIPLDEFFIDPTIAFLARRINKPDVSRDKPLEIVTQRSSLPMTPPQQLFWRLQKMLGYEFTNGQKIVISGIDEVKMQKAIDECMQNNAIFGLRVIDGQPRFEYIQEHLLGNESILLKEENGKYIFSISLPALLSDGFTINLLIRQIVESYVSGHVQRSSVDFPDYLVWRNQQGINEYSRDYWNQRLPLINECSYDFISKKEGFAFKPETVTIDISEDDAKQIYHHAQVHKVTANTLFTALLSFCLRRFANAASIVVGLVMDDRQHPDTLQMPGMFRKLLPLVLSLEQEQSEDFNKHLLIVNEVLMEAMTHKNYDYEIDLIDSNAFLFPCFHPVIQFHETVSEKNANEASIGIEMHEVTINHYSVPFALKCDVFRLEEGLQFCFSYNSALLADSKIEAILTEFQSIIKDDILLQAIVEV